LPVLRQPVEYHHATDDGLNRQYQFDVFADDRKHGQDETGEKNEIDELIGAVLSISQQIHYGNGFFKSINQRVGHEDKDHQHEGPVQRFDNPFGGGDQNTVPRSMDNPFKQGQSSDNQHCIARAGEQKTTVEKNISDRHVTSLSPFQHRPAARASVCSHPILCPVLNDFRASPA
jgi:hypothetical protein